MSWFKVELDQKTGKILKTTRVAAAEKDGRFIRYVEAEKKQDANDLALRWYAIAARRMANVNRMRQKRKASGICLMCTDPAAPGHQRCAKHIELGRQYGRLWYARQAGRLPPTMKDSRTAKQKYVDFLRSKKGYEETRRSQRLTVLLDVRAALFANRDFKAFTSWLNKRIKEEEKRVATPIIRRGTVQAETLRPVGSSRFRGKVAA